MEDHPERNEEEPPVEEKPVLAALSEVQRADCLHVLNRVLSRALREEGLHLWEERFLKGNAMRPIKRLLGSEIEAGLREELTEFAAVFEGIMDVPWFERIEPLQALLPRVNALADKHPVVIPDFNPVAEVLLKDQSAGPNKKETQRERGPKRGRGRRSRGASKSEPRKPARAPRNPAHELGDSRYTGMALSEVNGIDQELVVQLAEHGVSSVQELLLLGPKSHQILKSVQEDQAVEPGENQGISGTVRSRWIRLLPGKRFHEALVEGVNFTVKVHWPEGVGDDLPEIGGRVGLVGTLVGEEGVFSMESPRACRADSRGVIRLPEYGLEGIDDAGLNGMVVGIMDRVLPGLKESLPEKVLKLGNVSGLRQSIRELHLPTGGIQFGKNRFVFEELFRHQLALAAKERQHRKGIGHPIQHELISQLQIQHGIVLDDSQERAFDEVRRDLSQPLAMNRLLQGDVGSGKALVALLSAVLVAASRSQALFVAPNALAAEHRYLFAESLLRSVGLVPQLITGKPSAGQLDAIKRGQANLIFVTPDFIEPVVPEFKKLGLVVVEERSAFGKIRCDTFTQGKLFPDFMVVTPVPLPPSLAFTVFSDMDITIIQDTEGPVPCEVAPPDKRDDVYNSIREILESGRQAYIVFPMRAGADVIDRERGQVLANAMAQEAFPGHTVGLFHGEMNRDERAKVFDDFLHRKIDVLISTTAIEDAPEIDNAAGIMVENADHFDLIRLYRLRGHLVSKDEGAKCFFVLSKEPSEAGAKLVEFVAKDADAFTLAERDREMRGDDALLGERKGDLPDFQWADLSKDRKLLLKARRSVFSILAEDPALQRRTYRGLVEEPTRAASGRTDGKSESSGGRSRRRRRPRRRNSGGKRKESAAE